MESAIQFCTVCFSASGPPWATRLTARSHIMSKARFDWPSQRMAWWILPGPRRSWASAKPAPSSPMRFSAGTRTESKMISAWFQ